MNEVIEQQLPTPERTPRIIYILYLVSIVFGLTAIIGVVMAYVNKSDAPDWLKSHYQFQIRTFWIGGLYILIGLFLSLIVIGYLVLLFCVIWLIIRCIKGLKAIDQRAAYPNPKGWMF